MGGWRLVVQPAVWSGELQNRILALADQQSWAQHPQTIPLSFSDGRRPIDLYLKIIHSSTGGAVWKNWFRRSKALQAWRQGLALSEAGFNVPIALAAGTRRHFGALRRGFILTQKVEGEGAPEFLRENYADQRDKRRLKIKRTGIKQLAVTIRRFHDGGFVHGDLVATNIFIHRSADDQIDFYFMDNDRTRRYPLWLRQTLWKRNLIQLNRLPLPGISLQDRMRFFCADLGKTELSAAERQLARWFEHKTRQRRKECDHADGAGDFRRLMRWSGDLADPEVDRSQ